MHCVCNFVFVIFVMYFLSVYVLFCVLYRIVLCIVVPQPPGTYPLAVNNNKKIIKKFSAQCSDMSMVSLYIIFDSDSIITTDAYLLYSYNHQLMHCIYLYNHIRMIKAAGNKLKYNHSLVLDMFRCCTTATI